jgi:hypothetical protein
MTSLAVLSIFEKLAEATAGLDGEEALQAVVELENKLDEDERGYAETIGLLTLHALQNDRGSPL